MQSKVKISWSTHLGVSTNRVVTLFIVIHLVLTGSLLAQPTSGPEFVKKLLQEGEAW